MSKPTRLVLGKVARPRGLRGEFFLDIDAGCELARGAEVRLEPSGTQYLLERLTRAQGRSLVKLAGVDTIEAAEALRGAELSVARQAVPAPLLLNDLVGCLVVDADSADPLGTVKDWLELPGHDLLELDNGLLIPAVDAFLIEINVEAGQIRVRLPEGLRELQG